MDLTVPQAQISLQKDIDDDNKFNKNTADNNLNNLRQVKEE